MKFFTQASIAALFTLSKSSAVSANLVNYHRALQEAGEEEARSDVGADFLNKPTDAPTTRCINTTFVSAGTMDVRLFRDGSDPSTCAAPKLEFPGTTDGDPPGPFKYMKLGPFGGAKKATEESCVTITWNQGTCLISGEFGLFPVTYSSTFDPADQAAGYVADPSSNDDLAPLVWNFTLPKGDDFFLVYQQVNATTNPDGCVFETCIDFA
jgi:hypothetical protein